jgi:hypothetical protein
MKFILVIGCALAFGAVAARSTGDVSLFFYCWWLLVMFGLGMWVANRRHKNMAIAMATSVALSKARAEASSVAHSQQAVIVNVGDHQGRLDRSEYKELYDVSDMAEIGLDSEASESVDEELLDEIALAAWSVESAADGAQAGSVDPSRAPSPDVVPRPSVTSSERERVLAELAALLQPLPASSMKHDRQVDHSQSSAT